jgi:Flp pilus assembly protein TadD
MKFFLYLTVLLATSIYSFPQTAQDYYQEGNDKIRLNDYKATIQACDKAIELNPGFAKAYNLRGFSKDKLQYFSGAISDLNMAIQLDSNYVEAYNNRGIVKNTP